ncbi:MAG: potassium channel family protein [Candidatus Eisenbacteria bacterium]|nr:potassium channel family protein [Candidatus Eisenbacteria bacterium]
MSIPAFVPVVVGTALILIILWDAFETILVPRRIGRRVRLTRYFYLATWRIWRFVARRVRKPSRREGMLGFYGPLSLIVLLFCWMGGLVVGFALLGVVTNGGVGDFWQSFGLQLYMSGETFFTLGFGDFTPTTTLGRILAVLEAGLGFGFLGTVVGYLPTMYGAFAQREIEISLMDARAGSPPLRWRDMPWSTSPRISFRTSRPECPNGSRPGTCPPCEPFSRSGSWTRRPATNSRPGWANSDCHTSPMRRHWGPTCCSNCLHGFVRGLATTTGRAGHGTG